ncbi:MAG: linear amide C-N hydrolase [Mycobacteriaceae bacterium]|nr:linear amide C-N hydrolase [Mycobacteriaceae bacterium]
MWTESGQGMLVGRNMDWKSDMPTDLWVLPRGTDRVGMPDDSNPLRWTASYGSLVASPWNITTADGLNEAGLGGHVLWLADSDFGPRTPALPALSASLWMQYFLDCFATVDEVVGDLSRRPVQVRPTYAQGETSTIHLAFEDRSGDSVVLEYVDGTPRVHHDRNYTVMTNSPPFEEQLAHLKRYEGFGGAEQLPGTTQAADRFVRASYYSARLPKADTKKRAYAALLSVMRNAAQPFGTGDPARPDISSTLWRTMLDLSDRVYAFESSFSPDIVWVHPDRLDHGRCLRLDLSSDDLVGDVTDRFTAADPFTFVP